MTTATAAPEIGTFERVPLLKIRESATNPRRTFTPQEMDELTQSIREKGVTVPVCVRPVKDGFELVYGARRFRASKAAGLEEIPALIRNYTDVEALEVQVLENKVRQDVHPLEEAQGFRALMDAGKYTAETLARRIGMSESHIYMRLKLLDLVPPVKKAFLEGKITAGHAEKIARLKDDIQHEALKACLPDVWLEGVQVKSQLSVRDLGEWLKNNHHEDLTTAVFPLDLDGLAKKVACVSCPLRAKNAPGLFADLQGGDTCTNSGCFQEKTEDWFRKRVKELAGKGGKVDKVAFLSEVQSHASRTPFRGECVWPDDWKRASSHEDCPHFQKGLIVEGKHQGAAINVCLTKTCKAHWPKASAPAGSASTSSGSSSSTSSSPSASKAAPAADREREKAKREAEEAKAKLVQTVKLEAYRQILNKVRTVPRLVLVALITRELESGDDYAPLDEIVPGLSKLGHFLQIKRKLAALPDLTLTKLAVGAALCGEFDAQSVNTPIASLGDVAKAVGVDLKSVEKGVRGKLEAEARLKAQIKEAVEVSKPKKKSKAK